jgi:hypothetical protein
MTKLLPACRIGGDRVKFAHIALGLLCPRVSLPRFRRRPNLFRGHAGETPPIFAQAAGVPFVYVACGPPSPQGETLADLKEERIALNKGSNVHYLLVRALERARLKYSEIEPTTLHRPTRAPPSNAARSMPGLFGIRSALLSKRRQVRARRPMAADWRRTGNSSWPAGRSRARMTIDGTTFSRRPACDELDAMGTARRHHYPTGDAFDCGGNPASRVRRQVR